MKALLFKILFLQVFLHVANAFVSMTSSISACPTFTQITGNIGSILKIRGIPGTNLAVASDSSGVINVFDVYSGKSIQSFVSTDTTIYDFYVDSSLMVNYIVANTFITYSLRERAEIAETTLPSSGQYLGLKQYNYTDPTTGTVSQAFIAITQIIQSRVITLYLVLNNQINFNAYRSYNFRTPTNTFGFTSGASFMPGGMMAVVSNSTSQSTPFVVMVSASGTIMTAVTLEASTLDNINVIRTFDNYLLPGNVTHINYFPSLDTIFIQYAFVYPVTSYSASACYYNASLVTMNTNSQGRQALSLTAMIASPLLCSTRTTLSYFNYTREVVYNNVPAIVLTNSNGVFLYESSILLSFGYKYTNYVYFKFRPDGTVPNNAAMYVYQVNNNQLLFGTSSGFVNMVNINSTYLSGYIPLAPSITTNPIYSTSGASNIWYYNIGQVTDTLFQISQISTAISSNSYQYTGYYYDRTLRKRENYVFTTITLISTSEVQYDYQFFNLLTKIYVNTITQTYFPLVSGACPTTSSAPVVVNLMRFYFFINGGAQTEVSYSFVSQNLAVQSDNVRMLLTNRNTTNQYYFILVTTTSFDFTKYCLSASSPTSRLLQNNEQNDSIIQESDEYQSQSNYEEEDDDIFYLGDQNQDQKELNQEQEEDAQNQTNRKRHNRFLQTPVYQINFLILNQYGTFIYDRQAPLFTYTGTLLQGSALNAVQNQEGTVVIIHPSVLIFVGIQDNYPSYTFPNHLLYLSDIIKENLVVSAGLQNVMITDFKFVVQGNYFMVCLSSTQGAYSLVYYYNRDWYLSSNTLTYTAQTLLKQNSSDPYNYFIDKTILYNNYTNFILFYNAKTLNAFSMSNTGFQLTFMHQFSIPSSSVAPIIYYSVSDSTFVIFTYTNFYELKISPCNAASCDQSYCVFNKYINYSATQYANYQASPATTNPLYVYSPYQITAALLDFNFVSAYYTSKQAIYQLNVNVGQVYEWNSAHFQINSGTSTTQSTSVLILQSYTESSTSTTQSLFTISSTTNIRFDGYQQLLLQNFVIVPTQSTVPFTPLSFSSSYVTVNNVSINQISYTTPVIALISGNSFLFQNFVLKNMFIKGGGAMFLVSTSTTPMQMSFQNVQIEDNTLINTSLIYSPSREIQYSVNNLSIERNVFSFSSGSASGILINSSNYTFNQVRVINNIFANCAFLNIYTSSSYFIGVFTNSLIYSNLIFVGSSSSTVFFSAEFTQQYSSTSLTLQNIYISTNQFIADNYSRKYILQYFQSMQAHTPYTQAQNLNAAQVNYFLKTNYIKTTNIQNIGFIDNYNSNFLMSSISTSVVANQIQCKYTQMQSISTFCLQILNHVDISVALSNVYVQNYYLLDSYAIAISSLATLQTNANVIISNITLSNITTSNVQLLVDSHYFEAVTIAIKSYKVANILLDSIFIDGVTLTTPQLVMNEFASSLSVLAPFSALSLTNSQISNTNNLSLKTSVLIVTKTASLSRITMINNNLQNSQSSISGGQMEIRVNTLVIQDSQFNNSIALNGGALNLAAADLGSTFEIINTSFYNQIASADGGAIYANDVQQNAVITLQACTFSQAYASVGGAVFLNSMANYNNSMIISQCQANNTFSNSQGSFLYIINAYASITSFTSLRNSPQDTSLTSQMQTTLKTATAIGPYFSIVSSRVVLQKLIIQSMKILNGISYTNPVLFSITQSSSSIMSQLDISRVQYSLGGAFLISDSSQVSMTDSKLYSTKFATTAASRFRLLSLSLSAQTSMIVITSSANLQMSNVNAYDNTCQSSTCVSSTLYISSATASIYGSTFLNNTVSTFGGVITITNPTSSVSIVDSTFTENSASTTGGALFLQNSNSNEIQILGCTFDTNKATIGGGLYAVDENTDQLLYLNWLRLSGNTFIDNTATEFAGAYFIQSNKTHLESSIVNNVFEDNQSGLKYGGDSMTSTSKLILDIDAIMLANSGIVLKDISFLNVQMYLLKNYTSGSSLPSLVLRLLDQNGNIIDKSYQTAMQKEIVTSVSFASNNDYEYYINQQSSYYYLTTDTSYVIDELTVTATPGTFVWLNITSSTKNVASNDVDLHYLLLGLDVRNCQLGEIYEKLTSVVGGDYNLDILLKCVSCPYGTYQLTAPNLKEPIFECNKCQQNTECLGGDQIKVNSGYWRDSNTSDTILQCSNNENNCLGGLVGNECILGTVGPLCESCDLENYYSSSGNFICSQCEGQFINSLKVIAVILFYAALTLMTTSSIIQKIQSKYKNNALKLKKQTSMNFFQKVQEKAKEEKRQAFEYSQSKDVDKVKMELNKEANSNPSNNAMANTNQASNIPNSNAHAVTSALQDLNLKSLRKMIADANKKKSLLDLDPSVLLKIIINYMQIVSVITTFKIQIPTQISGLISVAGNPAMLISNYSQCFYQTIAEQNGVDYLYLSLVGSILYPVFCSVIFFIIGIAKYHHHPQIRRVHITTSLIYCFLYFQPSIFKQCVNLLYCREIDNEFFVSFDLRYSCYTPLYNFWSLVLVLPIILIVSVIIPGYMILAVSQVMKSHIKIMPFTILKGEYDKHYWYWEIVRMYMKLIIMGILIVYDNDVPLKATLIFLILFTYGVFLSKCRPYLIDFYNTMDIVATKFLIFSIIFGFISYATNGQLIWYLFMSILLAAVNVIFVVWAFRYVIYAYIPLFRAKLNARLVRILRMKVVRCILSKKVIRRWLVLSWFQSFKEELKKKNLVNFWSGKMKATNDQIQDIITSKLQLTTSRQLSKNKISVINLDSFQKQKLNLQRTFDSQILTPNNHQNHLNLGRNSNFSNEIETPNLKLNTYQKSQFAATPNYKIQQQSESELESIDKRSQFNSETNLQFNFANTPISVHKLISDLQSGRRGDNFSSMNDMVQGKQDSFVQPSPAALQDKRNITIPRLSIQNTIQKLINQQADQTYQQTPPSTKTPPMYPRQDGQANAQHIGDIENFIYPQFSSKIEGSNQNNNKHDPLNIKNANTLEQDEVIESGRNDGFAFSTLKTDNNNNDVSNTRRLEKVMKSSDGYLSDHEDSNQVNKTTHRSAKEGAIDTSPQNKKFKPNKNVMNPFKMIELNNMNAQDIVSFNNNNYTINNELNNQTDKNMSKDKLNNLISINDIERKFSQPTLQNFLQFQSASILHEPNQVISEEQMSRESLEIPPEKE